MAHTVTITKLLDGPRHAIFHTYLKCDGTTGEIQDAVVISLADVGLNGKSRLTIEEIWWDFSGFGVRLEFNDLVDTPIWTISPGASNHINLQNNLGGLLDRSGLDGNGSLLFNTYGFDSATKQGTFIIKIRK